MVLLTGSLLSTLGAVMAYLDPGTGSILIQLLIAGLLAVGVVLRVFWGRISKLFGKSKPNTSNPEAGSEDEEDK